MLEKIIISGVGGQGVMLTGKLMCYAAIHSDRYATFLPEYGAQQRGGPARCTVILSDEPISSPVAGRTDTLMAFNQNSVTTFLSKVKEGGKVFANASQCKVETQRTDISVIELPTDELADAMGVRQVGNLIMLGAFVEKTKIFTQAEMNAAIEYTLGAGKTKFIEINEAAVAKGMALVK